MVLRCVVQLDRTKR